MNMGWQIGFRWDGVYHSYVVLAISSEEAVRLAKGAIMLSADARVQDLTVVRADGCVYKA